MKIGNLRKEINLNLKKFEQISVSDEVNDMILELSKLILIDYIISIKVLHQFEYIKKVTNIMRKINNPKNTIGERYGNIIKLVKLLEKRRRT